MVNALLNKYLIQAIQVTSLECSKTCYSSNIILEENNLPLIIIIVFFHKLMSMQNVGQMLHLNVAWQLPSL